MKPINVQNVPCHGCTACCQGDMIFLHPEMGDDPRLYKTVFKNGRYILQHKPNKDCIYLDRQKGCTIHDHRPAICQELDCRFVFQLPKKQLKMAIKNGLISKKILHAARILRKKHGL